VLMAPVAFASKRFRLPALAFGAVALAGWLLNLDRLIAAKPVRDLALRLGIGELWLRDPSRFRYAVLLALTVLAGYGVQAWVDMGPVGAGLALRRRLWWLAPGLALFFVMPIIAGSRIAHYVPFLIGAAGAVPLLTLAARGRSWAAPAVAGALALELVVCGIVGQFGPPPGVLAQGLTLVYDPGLDPAFAKLHSPNVDPGAYLTPGAIGRVLIAGRGTYGRYLSFDERVAKGSSRGFLSHQSPNIWPAYENARSILFDLDEIQGYSPVQLQRYWRLVRASNTVPIFYNSSTFQSVDPAVMRLFDVRWVIVPTAQGPPPPVPGLGPGTHTLGTPRRVTSEGLFTLYEYPYAEPRTSVAYHVQGIAPGQGLRTVLSSSFEPADQALVEGLPSNVRFGPDPADQVAVGRTTYQELSPEHVRVSVATTAPGLLVIRNAYDSDWHATVDGRPAPVLLTDYMLQGVVVPAGNHVVELRYEDPWIGRGLLVSGVAWALLLAALGSLWASSRRRKVPASPQ
jgi:Bacterial membrane protein YfhO